MENCDWGPLSRAIHKASRWGEGKVFFLGRAWDHPRVGDEGIRGERGCLFRTPDPPAATLLNLGP